MLSKRTFFTARLRLFSLLGVILLLGAIIFAPHSAQADGNQRSLLAVPTPTPMRILLPFLGKPFPAGIPLVSTSLYVNTVDAQTLYDQGCAVGKRDLSMPGAQDTVVVLDFGLTSFKDNNYGASLMGDGPATVDQIGDAVKNFGYGYWKCVDSDYQSHIRLAIGTNNWILKLYSYPTSVTYEHGQAWGNMVNAVNDWFKNTCPNSCDGQVDAVGANDIELSWSSYTDTTKWLKGYDEATDYPLYNFGAIEGCPYTYVPATTTKQCGGNNGVETFYWTRDQILSVTWRSGGIYPIPEIYANNGVNAKQWYYLSVFSFERTGSKMQFIGPMTEYGACQQYPSGCTGINSPPDQSWKLLYDLLNSDVRTSGESLPYLTDIRYLQ